MTTQTRTPVIARDLAERIADFLKAAGFDSPYSPNPNAPRVYQGAHGDHPGYLLHPSAADSLDLSEFGALPKFWTCDVADVIADRARAKAAADLEAAVEALDTTAPIRRYLHFQRAEGFRGMYASRLERVDLSKRFAVNPRRAYTPAGACGARLKLAEAVAFATQQQAYSDNAYYVIPVELTPAANLDIMRANLARWAHACSTATGWAGEGYTLTATLEADALEGCAFVVLDVRASIAD